MLFQSFGVALEPVGGAELVADKVRRLTGRSAHADVELGLAEIDRLELRMDFSLVCPHL